MVIWWRAKSEGVVNCWGEQSGEGVNGLGEGYQEMDHLTECQESCLQHC